MDQNTIYDKVTEKILDSKTLSDDLRNVFEKFDNTCVESISEENFGEHIPKLREEICNLQSKFDIVGEYVKAILRLSKDYLNNVNSEEFPTIYGRVVKLRSVIENHSSDNNSIVGVLYIDADKPEVLDISTVAAHTVFGVTLDKICALSNELKNYSNETTNKFIEMFDKHSAYPDVDFRGEFTLEQVYARIKSWNLLVQTYCEIIEIMQIMVEHSENNLKVLNAALDHLSEVTNLL